MGERDDCILAERLHEHADETTLPAPTMPFRIRAWLTFQRALDPLARPRPLRLPGRRQT
jgi:hypothetical protein